VEEVGVLQDFGPANDLSIRRRHSDCDRPVTKGRRRVSVRHVSTDFQGNYGLGGQETTIDCVSNGGLEQDLIAVAGGPSKERH